MIWTSLIAQGKRRLWMSLLVATLLGLVYLHFARFYQGRAPTWLLVVTGVPVVANVVRAAITLSSHLNRHPLGTLDLGLGTDQTAPGGAFELEIRARARRSFNLKGLAAELRCTREKNTERGRETALLHREEVEIAADVPFEAGLDRSYEVKLPLPEDAPFSFRSMEGKIQWAIHVMVEIEDWGEIRDELEVTVAPG